MWWCSINAAFIDTVYKLTLERFREFLKIVFRFSKMSKLDPCKIGADINDDCHKTWYTYGKKKGFKKYSELSPEQKMLLEWWSGVSFDDNDCICLYHLQVYYAQYSDQQRFCCNPFNKHATKRKNFHWACFYVYEDQVYTEIYTIKHFQKLYMIKENQRCKMVLLY